MWDNSRMKFPQAVQIPGKPKVLAINATGNAGGWEDEMAARICNVMRRLQVDVIGPVKTPERSDANCLFIIASENKLAGLLSEIGKLNTEKSKVLAIYIADSLQPALDRISFAL